ncbi:MAG: hypothetical protein JSR60_06030 [Proteobacteria bacterium]|nr:hypothetical protein [Pseudomonadota bacterium]
MSAVFGIFRFDGLHPRLADLERQSNALAHAGGDRAAIRIVGQTGIGHRLRRLTREDFLDDQPHTSGSLTISADVRIDNRNELAAAFGLDTSTLQKLPDSALIAEAYRHWGANAPEHLIGDFAFVVWDEARRELFAARDHMGQRPFYFHRSSDFIAFASDVRGLWTVTDVPRELDVVALGYDLSRERTARDRSTTFAGIEALAGGSSMLVSTDGATKHRRYWTPSAAPSHLNRDAEYYVRTYRAILGEAVACRVRRSTNPPAVCLGGGFDSGAIASLTCSALPGSKVVGVASVLPPSDPPTGVRRWVSLLADRWPQLDVHWITREKVDILAAFESNFRRTGQPSSPNIYTNTELYAAAAAAGARQLMDGFGGDYTVNPRGRGWPARRLREGRLRLFLRELAAYRRHNRLSWAAVLRREVVMPFLPSGVLRAWLRFQMGLPINGTTAPLSSEMTGRIAGQFGALDFSAPVRSRRLTDMLTEVLARQQGFHAPGGTIHASSLGLELTRPYHDKRVVEFALAIPDELHVKNGVDRYLARTALRDLLPEAYQQRSSSNDVLIPDFSAAFDRIRPDLLREIGRMERSSQDVAKVFDFARMRALAVFRRSAFRRGPEAVPHMTALHAYNFARYVEWFRRDNRPPPDDAP